MEYRKYSEELKEKYGGKVYKLSLSSGCTCPNRDGTLSYGGCTFCSEGGSGEFAAGGNRIQSASSVHEQIAEARKLVDGKFPGDLAPEQRKYIAYFQSFTNTYGDTEYLRGIFDAALSEPGIVGLNIGTRPDCLQDEKLRMLDDLRKKHGKEIVPELGLQTIHERTAVKIRRGYPLSVFEDCFARCSEQGFPVVVHLILGLPGETEEDMLESVRWVSALSPAPAGIKLQMLNILRGSALAEEYESSPFPLMDLDDYCRLIVKCLKLIPKETAVHRLTGDGPKKLLIAPLWAADKKRVMNTLGRAIREA